MKRLTVPMTRWEITLGFLYLALQLTVIPLALQLGNLLLGEPLSQSEVNFLFFCLNFLCVTVIFHKFLLESVRVALSSIGRCLGAVGCGLLLYWLLQFLCSMIITACFPDFFNVNDDSIAGLVEENADLMTIGTVLLVPVVEESLYRGLVFRSLYNRNRIAGYVVSVAVFAALHVVGYIGMYPPAQLILCFLQYVPAGICLGWAYARTNTIIAPILIHISVNLIGMIAMR